MANSPKILVLGYGNQSRADDGVGPAVLAGLEGQHLGVDLVTCHQLEVDHAEAIGAYDLVIFVDAAIPEAPVRINRCMVKPDLRSHAVAHYLAPSDVLALSKSLYDKEPTALLFSIRGQNFGFSTQLSPDVAAACAETVAQISALIRAVQRGAAPAALLGEDPSDA
jgi:hydrogenase maturation protease